MILVALILVPYLIREIRCYKILRYYSVYSECRFRQIEYALI